MEGASSWRESGGAREASAGTSGSTREVAATNDLASLKIPPFIAFALSLSLMALRGRSESLRVAQTALSVMKGVTRAGQRRGFNAVPTWPRGLEMYKTHKFRTHLRHSAYRIWLSLFFESVTMSDQKGRKMRESPSF